MSKVIRNTKTGDIFMYNPRLLELEGFVEDEVEVPVAKPVELVAAINVSKADQSRPTLSVGKKA